MFRRFSIALRWISTLLPALVGLGFVFTDFANLWLRAGVAVLMCAVTFRRAAFSPISRTHLEPATVLRICAVAYTIAACLCAIGSIVWGGAIGWLGVFLSLWIAILGWTFH
jgi:hypothetical protein